MTRAEALTWATRIPIGSRLVQEYRRCGGKCCQRKGFAGHGPYWYAMVSTGRKRPKRQYVGSDAARALLLRAWEIIGEEIAMLERRRAEATAAALAKLEASPEARRLAELHAAATRDRKGTIRRRPTPTRARVAAVPVFDMGTLRRAGGAQK